MKQFQYNELIDYLEVDLHFMQEGMNYAEKNKYDSIRIVDLNTKDNISENIDFYTLNHKAFIKRLMIEDIKLDKKQALSMESIYTLKNLKMLSLKGNKIELDLSKLTQLEALYYKYGIKIKNVESLSNLKDLFILSFRGLNLNLLKGLLNLKRLRLSGGDFVSLDGIGALNKLERLDITYNSKLADATQINELICLREFHIEKCKSLNDFSFLEGNSTIEELFIDKLNSLSFISSMKKLKSINFGDCIDGDMTTLLKLKNLEQINFYPNKKHYTHTLDEIIDKTGARRGRYK